MFDMKLFKVKGIMYPLVKYLNSNQLESVYLNKENIWHCSYPSENLQKLYVLL